MAGPRQDDPKRIPSAHPDPAGNTGYAEPKPRDKAQARIPGARKPPDSEEGGLEHEPDQGT